MFLCVSVPYYKCLPWILCFFFPFILLSILHYIAQFFFLFLRVLCCFFSAPSLTLSVFVCCPSAHNTTSSTFIHIEIYISWIFIIVVTRAFIKYVWVRASAYWCHISVSVSFHWHSFPQLTLTLPLSLYMCLAHINFSSDMKKNLHKTPYAYKHWHGTDERAVGRMAGWNGRTSDRARVSWPQRLAINLNN